MSRSLVLGFCLLLTSACVLSKTTGGHSSKDGEEKQWILEENVDRFTDPEAVRKFKPHFDRGLLGKNERFDTKDPKTMEATTRFIEALKSAKDATVFADLGRVSMKNWNIEQSAYALSKGILNWPKLESRDLNIFQEWYHMFPSYFVPKRVIEETKAAIADGTYDINNTPIFGPEESGDGAEYFREDAGLSVMFYNWHLNFASGYQGASRKSRGEMFFNYHNELVAAYATRSSNMDWIVDWDKPIKAGYQTDLSNSSGQSISSRSPDYPPPTDNVHYKELMEIVKKYKKIPEDDHVYINDSYSLSLLDNKDQVISILSDLLYNTTNSVNPSHYKSYFDSAREYVASLNSDPSKDAGGLVGHLMTALRDPAFYGVMTQVNNIIDYYKKWHLTYKREEVVIEGVKMISMSVSRLETFFETFDIGVTRALEESFDWKKYTVRGLRLNHKPYTITFNVTNNNAEPRDAIITVVMVSTLWITKTEKFQVLDRFVVSLKPGTNTIERSSLDSKIFSDEPYFVGLCGIPRRLALPKGSPEGLNVTFMATATPYDRQKDDSLEEGESLLSSRLGLSTLCGNNRFTYGKPLTFPFDRTIDDDISMDQMTYTSPVIFHERRTFSKTITM